MNKLILNIQIIFITCLVLFKFTTFNTDNVIYNISCIKPNCRAHSTSTTATNYFEETENFFLMQNAFNFFN